MHTATQANLTEGGQPKSDSSPKNPFMYKKEPKEPISCSGQLEPTWSGAVAGGVLIYTHIGGYGFESRCARAFLLLAFGALGRKSQRAQKASCARPQWRKLRVWRLAAGRFFSRLFRCVFCGLWCSATAGVKNMDFGHVADACFGITGARIRPIPTLLPSETCTQTPLDRPKMPLRRDPNFADAPETAQNGGFRHHFAAACVFADFDRQPVGIDLKHRLRADIGCETWLVPSIASRPEGTFLALKRAHMGTTAYVLAR